MELPRCLGGMWCPQKLIGEGSYGAVYLANHLILPTRKAVKRIELHDGNMDDIANEVGALQRLKGKPNIVQLWQWVEYEGALYIIMEFCQGGDLHDYLQLKGSLNEDCCRDIMIQMAEGLKAMRACNVVHRDLKPSNILLCDKGNQPRIKIADFGLARLLDGRACSAFSYVPSPYGYLLQGQASSQCGTMPYAAPEMESGPHGLDVDLWSVGVIMYEMLVGRHPFNADNYYDLMQSFRNDEIELPDDVAKKLSPACRDMLTRLLQRNPADRMSFAEFVIHPFFRGPSAVAATVEDENGQCDGELEEEQDHDDPEADLEDQELLYSSSLERLWMMRPDTLHTIEEEEAISLSGALHRARECTPLLCQSVLQLDCDARESDSDAAAINAEIDATDDADASEAESDVTVATSEVDSDDADATEAESDADGATSDFQGDAEADYFEGRFSIASAVTRSAVAAERAYQLCSSGSSDHVPSRVAHPLQVRRMAALLLAYACRVHLGHLHLEVLARQCPDGKRHRAGDLVKATVVAVSCCRWAYRLVVLASRSGDTEGGGGPEDDHKELSASLELHARSMLVMLEKHLSYLHDVLAKMSSRGCGTPPGTASDLISCQAVVAVAPPHPASAQDMLLEVALSHVRAAEDEEMLGNTAIAAAEYGKATDVLLFLLSAAALQQLQPHPRPTMCDQQTPLEAVRPPMAQNFNPRFAVLYARTRMRQSGIHAAMRTTAAAAAAAAATTSEVTVQAMSVEAVVGLQTPLNANRRSWWQWMFG
ncbi:hypothetical protein Vretimale_8326 [Volvox reticuliferus]|uniref:Protein kinase domain-containing protein n=1 Tax=Volvox reticuliferus TaxID=1737510 RepID=A0A8J4GAZ2_9CHLO|nr:hypothetical protein Vretifemale_11702 [Volvox reticuliferus]GIM03595.1 hypothetical protein Vretimale_8326 [Volvox reticuliferus]